MWKCGLHEPSISAGEVTELIFQPNGKTYADWGFKFEVDVMEQRREKERSKYGGCGGGGCGNNGPHIKPSIAMDYHGGCGSGGCGGSGRC
jgi:hypothetical protein